MADSSFKAFFKTRTLLNIFSYMAVGVLGFGNVVGGWIDYKNGHGPLKLVQLALGAAIIALCIGHWVGGERWTIESGFITVGNLLVILMGVVLITGYLIFNYRIYGIIGVWLRLLISGMATAALLTPSTAVLGGGEAKVKELQEHAEQVEKEKRTTVSVKEVKRKPVQKKPKLIAVAAKKR